MPVNPDNPGCGTLLVGAAAALGTAYGFATEGLKHWFKDRRATKDGSHHHGNQNTSPTPRRRPNS